MSIEQEDKMTSIVLTAWAVIILVLPGAMFLYAAVIVTKWLVQFLCEKGD